MQCRTIVKSSIGVFFLCALIFFSAFLLYARILGLTRTFDCVTEITFALLAVINTIIYLRNDLYRAQDVLNKKNVTNVGMIFVILAGMSIPVFYLSFRFPFLVNQERDMLFAYNATNFNPDLFFAGDILYDVFTPVFAVMILVNNVIFLRRILDFSEEVKTVQRYIRGLVSSKTENESFTTETLKEIDSKITYLCDTNDELDISFNMSMLILVGIVPVRILNIAGFVITQYSDLTTDIITEQVLHFLNAIFSFVMSCDVSNNVEYRKMKTVKSLTQLTMQGTYLKDQRFAITVREIRTLIEENDFAVNVYGYFNMDRELIVAMVGILLTYCILIYQFSHVL